MIQLIDLSSTFLLNMYSICTWIISLQIGFLDFHNFLNKWKLVAYVVGYSGAGEFMNCCFSTCSCFFHFRKRFRRLLNWIPQMNFLLVLVWNHSAHNGTKFSRNIFHPFILAHTQIFTQMYSLEGLRGVLGNKRGTREHSHLLLGNKG